MCGFPPVWLYMVLRPVAEGCKAENRKVRDGEVNQF